MHLKTCVARATALAFLLSISAHAQFSIAPVGTFGSGGWLAPTGVNGSTYSFLTTGDTERGMAYGNNHVYLVSRNGGDFIRILDAQSGADLGALNLGSGIVTGGTFDVNMVAVAADGAIYVANLTTGTTPFRIYRWADDLPGTTPTLVYNGNPLAGARLGDSLAAFGSGGNTLLAAGFNSAPSVAGNNGYAIIDPTLGSAIAVSFGSTPPAAGDFRLAISFIDSTHVIGTQGGAGNSVLYTTFSAGNGTVLATPVLASTDERPMSFTVVAGFPLMAALSTTDNHVSLYDMTDPSQPKLVGQANATTGALPADAHNTGAISWGKLNGNTVTLYAMASDDGIQAFLVTLPAPTPVAITNQPQNQTVTELLPATFRVGATGFPPPTYQWYQGNSLIAGATNSTYTIPAAPYSANGAQFKVVAQNIISNTTYTSTSSVATLTVLADTNPPVLLGALSIGLTQVQVTLSKPVTPATATNAANYSITASNGPVSILAAALDSSQSNVVLSVSSLFPGSFYTLSVSNLAAQTAAGTIIDPNSTASFFASFFTPAAIGNPPAAGGPFSVSGGLGLSSAGADIGGTSDQFQFAYRQVTGDFDLSVDVASLALSDLFAKAGLMAREALLPGSRFAAALATPSIVGSFFEWRDPASSAANASGSFPGNYPNTWLRLKRTGNTFAGFGSYDGRVWTSLGSATIAMAPQIYVGVAVSSHDTNQTAAAQFLNVAQPVTSTVVATVVNPHEPPGPSSRRTCLAITEIMFKPAPRTDGKNLEFIEVYNSNPFWEDISGHRLSGDIDFTFPPNTILRGGGFLVVAAAPADVQSIYGVTNVAGPYAGSLKKTGSIVLSDKTGTILLEIPYLNTPPWPVAADGTGHSLVLARPSYGGADGRAWAISDGVGGSPGGADPFRPSPLRDVVINEILAHSENPSVLDYIELYNHSNQTNDLSGCILTDDPATNKFVLPAGTLIPPRGFLVFDQTQLGFGLKASGETVYFRNPDASRVLDAVAFEASADGVAYGRWPDGASDFYALAARTPGAPNSPILIGDVVINELMYKPISGNDDDQYVELYNKGTNTVNLGGWSFSAGITFSFASNTFLAGGSYLVVARNVTNLFAHYPNLNVGNTVGNFTGKLPHKGGRVALSMPKLLLGTNSHGAPTATTLSVVEDEVTYSAGGRWGQWASGGGSSLELINPNSNHRLAYNWADSDETGKSSWTNLEVTGVMDNGSSYNGSPVDFVQLGLLDVGECLVDNVECRPGTTGANYIANPDFEAGLGNWTPQGDHIRSSLETSLGGYLSSQSLHLRSSDGVWTLFNSVQGTLNNTTLGAGATVTLRLKGRWLHGSPEILMRLRGNWLELAGAMPIPANLGTPGMRNSRFTTNAPPAIFEVKHSPSLPPASQPVVVTARFHDTQGFQPAVLYRIDTAVNPTPSYTRVAMVDDGTSGDAVAGDGLYTATIPAQSAGTVVAFLVQAQDGLGATATFPAKLGDNSGLPRECVVMFGDTVPRGSFGHYHLFMTQNWINRWASLGGVSNEGHDATYVDGGGRIIYNMTGRYAGSPYHQYTGSPVTTLGGMHWGMPEDDQMLGTTSFNKQHVPGNGPLDDTTLVREQTSFWMAKQLGLPWNYRRFYILYVNGNRHGPLMEDAQTPGSDLIKQHWPNDNNGFLYKNNSWFEGDYGLQPGGNINFSGIDACTLNEFLTTVNGVPNQHKLARYRWIYWIRQYPDSASNFTNVYNLVDAANLPANTPAYYNGMEAQVDTEEWMRLSAIEHATGDWDSFLRGDSWNMFVYKPLQGKWTVLKWDWNITLGVGGYSWGPDGNNLFTVSGDSAMSTFQTAPPYLRAYLRAFKEITQVAMNNTVVDPVLDARYAAFVANGLTSGYGVTVADPGASGGLKSWIATMRNSLLTALASQGVANVPFAVNGSSTLSTANNLLTFSGTAPVEVKTIIVNGVAYPVTWNTVTGWQLRLAVTAPTNILVFQGVDLAGNVLSNLSTTVSVTYTGRVVSPQGSVVINEIMYNPAATNAQYVEIYNTASSFTFDLSGWALKGIAYTFPNGTLIGPGGFLVLAKNRAAFSAAYGSSIPVFDTFSGTLQLGGETLTLLIPGAAGAPDQIIDQVTYASAPPWPGGANGGGFSLQLIDPAQDHQRVANWFGGVAQSNGWQFATASGVISGTNLMVYLAFPGDVYVDDIAVVPASGPFAGVNVVQGGDFESSLNAAWTIPTNMVSSALTTAFQHSGSSSLHLIETSVSAGLATTLHQSLPLAVSNVTCTLSLWYRLGSGGSNLVARAFPGSSVLLNASLQAPTNSPGHYSPGAANSARVSLPPFPSIWLNEIQPTNSAGPTDRFGHAGPWLELYNGGTNAIDLSGYYLATNYAQLFLWPFPTNTIIGSRQFLVVWLDANPAASTNTELHTAFTVAPISGSIALVNNSFGGGVPIIDYLNYNVPVAGNSYGDYPDGSVVGRRAFSVVTPGGTNNSGGPTVTVRINEWMAGNTRTIINPADGGYDDWFELYNADTATADLSHYYLSHDPANPFEFHIPSGYGIAPGGTMLVWADKLTSANNTNNSDLHVNFHLPKTGGVIGLFDPSGNPVDTVGFGPQTSDISMGRCPDGGSNIQVFSTPTPHVLNACNTAPVLTPIPDQFVYVGQTLAFYATATDTEAPPQTLAFTLDPGAPASAAINPGDGLFSFSAGDVPGTNSITVRVTDNGSPPLSATQTFQLIVFPPPPPPTLILANGSLSLTLPTLPGKSYRLDFKNDLNAQAWTPLSGTLTATDTTITVSDTVGTAAQRFYRLVPLP